MPRLLWLDWLDRVLRLDPLDEELDWLDCDDWLEREDRLWLEPEIVLWLELLDRLEPDELDRLDTDDLELLWLDEDELTDDDEDELRLDSEDESGSHGNTSLTVGVFIWTLNSKEIVP